MTEILLFICPLVGIFGSKKCRSYLIHTLSWQKGHTLQTLMMSLITLQYIVCWERKVSSIPRIHIAEYLLFKNYREHMLKWVEEFLFLHWSRQKQQKRQEPIGTDPRSQFPSPILLRVADI